MLTHSQVATLRAALLYWQEEMCPHAEAVMQPYYNEPEVASLSAAEVAHLRNRLVSDLRFVVYDRESGKLPDGRLHISLEEAKTTAGALKVATVILPAAEEDTNRCRD